MHRLIGCAVGFLVVLAGVSPASEELPALPRGLLLDGVRVGTVVVAVGERGTVIRSTDDGATWQRAAAPSHATLTGVTLAADGRHGWAVGHDALILGTVDGGLTWTRQFQGENLEDSFLDVLALDAQQVIAVGAYGLFAETVDAGRTWTRRKLGEDDFHLNRISRGPTGTLYLAGERGTVMRSTDRGAQWTRIAPPYEGSFFGVVPVDERTLMAHGLRGHLYRSTNDGANWERTETPQAVMLATGLRTARGPLLFAGHARTLLVSRDDGRTVANSPDAPATAVAELLELNDGSLLALGEAGVVRLPAPE